MISFEDLKIYCKNKHFSLSENAETIYESIKRRRGMCPCRVDEVMCPCPDHLDEIDDVGHCKCNLFVRTYYDPFPKFRRKYPDLFDIGGYFISFGFGPGWEHIVDLACSRIQRENEKFKPEDRMKIVQVKEKFGGLRLYTNMYTDETEKIIDIAERAAAETCENCGSKEDVSAKGGWIKTYCAKCHEALGRK